MNTALLFYSDREWCPRSAAFLFLQARVLRSAVEDIPVQAPHCLLHAGQGQSEIDAQMAGSVEHLSVLQGNSPAPAEVFQFPERFAAGFAPPGAVGEQHISPLGFCQRDAFKVPADIFHRIADIAGENLPELIQPGLTLLGISPDQGMHGEHIHLIIVTERRFLADALPKRFVVNNMIASHQARQIECL